MGLHCTCIFRRAYFREDFFGGVRGGNYNGNFMVYVNTVFPRINKGGDYSREGDYLREAIISNISLRRSRKSEIHD